nr:PREDICTED: multimerin-2 [Latimeria chalumnae]|eukprot:XP_006010287.1 PREDICTED: multimerin-2 [Latimeria chalumnae]
MIFELYLILCLLTMAKLDRSARIYEKPDHDTIDLSYNARLQDAGIRRQSYTSSPRRAGWGFEKSQTQAIQDSRNTHEMGGIASDSRNAHYAAKRGNWCATVNSHVITHVASCGTEKYVIKSQRPCPHGTPDCQTVMYRTAVRPVYKIKEKIITSLQWKCCPGHTGAGCEQKATESSYILTSENQTGREEVSQEVPDHANRDTIIKIEDQESRLQELQNDINQAVSNLQDLQRLLEENMTTTLDRNQTRIGFPERLLQQILLPYLENFLREHFTPKWASFNKSLQSLSDMVQNLSQDIATNRKCIEEIKEQVVHKRELEEFGTKFDSKTQENLVRLDQLKVVMDKHLHDQQANIHYNLTMIKAETDIKVKRNQKTIQQNVQTLNHTIMDMKREQYKLQEGFLALNRSLAIISSEQFCPPCVSRVQALTQTATHHLNQTLEFQLAQTRGLLDDSSYFKSSIIELQQQSREQKNELKMFARNLTVAKIEISLIAERDKVDEEKLTEINSTIINKLSSYEDLQQDVDTIRNAVEGLSQDMEKLYYNYSDSLTFEYQKQADAVSLLHEGLRNTSTLCERTQVSLEGMKQGTIELQNELTKSTVVLQEVYQSLAFEQAQIINNISYLQSRSNVLSRDFTDLKHRNLMLNNSVKYLNSSFNSLLEDTVRHATILESLLGEDILEITSEEDPEVLQWTMSELNAILSEISEKLFKQNTTLNHLQKRVLFLEMYKMTNNNSTNHIDFPGFGEMRQDNPEDEREKHSLEHMEPNHEAVWNADDSERGEVLRMIEDIKHLSMKIQQLESQWIHKHTCCNTSSENWIEPLNTSMETLRLDLASLKQLLDSHLSLFQKIFGDAEDLAASNVSLDISMIQSMVNTKMRILQKQEQGQQGAKKQTKTPVGQDNVLNVRNRKNIQLFENDSPVAFYVGSTGAADTNKIVKFNQIHLNYGASYSYEQGYFTAPCSGVYMFVITVEFGPGPVLGHLVVNSNRTVVTVQSKRKKQQRATPVTNYAILKLTKGQTVWFEVTQGALAQKSPPMTTFGGFLMFKT